MGVIKAIIGGLIGAVLATVILMFMRDGTLRGYEWFPIITGLLTGLGTRVLAGASPISAYVTGGVAALISLVAILGGDEAIELWKLRNMDLGPAPSVAQRAVAQAGGASAISADDDPTDTPAAEGDDQDAAVDEVDSADDDGGEPDSVDSEAASREAAARATTSQDSPTVHSAASNRKPLKGWRDYLPYIFSGVGVLLAYQVGGGGNRRRSSVVTENRDPHADDDTKTA